MFFNKSDIGKHRFFKINKLESLKPFIDNYKSPFYLYSKKVIEHQYELFRKNIPGNFNVFYAQKSNPNKEILKFIHGLGAGCDTASLMEMKNAMDAGFDNLHLMLTGPGKTEEELKFAISEKILSINVESFQELELINTIAKQTDIKQDILVRINPPFDSSEKNRIIGGSGISKFGIDLDQIPEFIELAQSMSNVNLNGIHIFNSSQILDHNKILQNTKDVINTAIHFNEHNDLKVKRIDLGGGFGIPYSEDESEMDINSLGEGLNEFFKEEKIRKFSEKVEMYFELGRYLSGLCGIYLTKVLYTKISRGKNIAVTDGGVHHLVRPALIGQNHPIVNLTALLEERTSKGNYLIAGPLCTSLDEFDDNAELPETKPGDILAILNAGAYGFTESMPDFLSHKKAYEEFIN
ncbi:MAG: hypothetical protein KDD00_02905 [Ignavibacteriae bacterium]|nr:hypothetical protein [Ignavibacteriota bacterium]